MSMSEQEIRQIVEKVSATITGTMRQASGVPPTPAGSGIISSALTQQQIYQGLLSSAIGGIVPPQYAGVVSSQVISRLTGGSNGRYERYHNYYGISHTGFLQQARARVMQASGTAIGQGAIDSAKLGSISWADLSSLKQASGDISGHLYAQSFRRRGLDAALPSRAIALQQAAGVASQVLQESYKRKGLGSLTHAQTSSLMVQLAGRGQDFGLSQFESMKDITDPDKVKTAASKLKATLTKKVQEIAKSLQPLRDIFGQDIPSMLSTIQAVAGRSVAGMTTGQLGARAQGLRSTLTVTGASMRDFAGAAAYMATNIASLDPRNFQIHRGNFDAAAQRALMIGSNVTPYHMDKQRFGEFSNNFVARSVASQASVDIRRAWSLYKLRNTGKTQQDFSNEFTALRQSGRSMTQAAIQVAGAANIHQLRFMGTTAQVHNHVIGRFAADQLASHNITSQFRQIALDSGVDRNTLNKFLGNSEVRQKFVNNKLTPEGLAAELGVSEAQAGALLRTYDATSRVGGNSGSQLIAAMINNQETEKHASRIRQLSKLQAELGIGPSKGISSVVQSQNVGKDRIDKWLELTGVGEYFGYIETLGPDGKSSKGEIRVNSDKFDEAGRKAVAALVDQHDIDEVIQTLSQDPLALQAIAHSDNSTRGAQVLKSFYGLHDAAQKLQGLSGRGFDTLRDTINNIPPIVKGKLQLDKDRAQDLRFAANALSILHNRSAELGITNKDLLRTYADNVATSPMSIGDDMAYLLKSLGANEDPNKASKIRAAITAAGATEGELAAASNNSLTEVLTLLKELTTVGGTQALNIRIAGVKGFMSTDAKQK